jgi:beta-1,4-mannosyl-glycoprotein beta-1,4-N-acetylglucosaminyltransferase
MVLEIDTGQALFDHITVTPAADWTCIETFDDECRILISVYDPKCRSEWQGGYTHTGHDLTAESFSFDLTDFITARAHDKDRDRDIARGAGGGKNNKNKLISVTGYNGEFILPFRLQYLFDVIDEFIIIESWYSHNGDKKSQLFFTAPENTEKFAPYMSKITYVVMEEYPPMTSQWVESYTAMFPNKLNEMNAFWNEDTQNLLAKFFVRPSAEPSGDGDGSEYAHTYVLVSDCDEIPHRDTLAALSIRSFPPSGILHLIMVMYAFNFYNLAPELWTFLYITPVNNFLEIEHHFVVRHMKNRNDHALQNGGFHLTSFMSYEGIRRKIRTFAHTTYNKMESILSCEHIRHSIEQGTDLFLRAELAAGYIRREKSHTRGEVGGQAVDIVPEGWEGLQADLERLQLDTCECCSQAVVVVAS